MIPAFLLIVAAVAYRIVTGLAITSGTTWLSNFAPMAAIALCGAAYFPARYKFTVPLIALFISDIVLNIHYHAPMLDPLICCRYLALIVVGLLGLALANRPSRKTLLPASLAGSVLFYVIPHAFAWLSDPGYAKNFAGLVQALTGGLPRSCPRPRPRHECECLHGGAVREGDRLLARARGFDAFLRQGAPHVWRARDRRGARAAGGGNGVRVEISRRRSRDPLLFWR